MTALFPCKLLALRSTVLLAFRIASPTAQHRGSAVRCFHFWTKTRLPNGVQAPWAIAKRTM